MPTANVRKELKKHIVSDAIGIADDSDLERLLLRNSADDLSASIDRKTPKRPSRHIGSIEALPALGHDGSGDSSFLRPKKVANNRHKQRDEAVQVNAIIFK